MIAPRINWVARVPWATQSSQKMIAVTARISRIERTWPSCEKSHPSSGMSSPGHARGMSGSRQILSSRHWPARAHGPASVLLTFLQCLHRGGLRLGDGVVGIEKNQPPVDTLGLAIFAHRAE